MDLRVAIVADWLTNYGGAEQVISAMIEAFPEADIYTTLFNKSNMRDIGEKKVQTSYLQIIPGAKFNHKLWIFQMPHAIERLDLSKYDVVLSSAHSIAKGVLTKVETLHLCYCHNPMRYCWDDWQAYIRGWGFPEFINKRIFRKVHKLRIWDRLAADRVDYYLANSNFVASRIAKFYRKKAEVLAPPVNIDNFTVLDNPTADYFFMAGRLVHFKNFDLVIKVFNELKLPLKIAGTGPELKKLQKLAGPTIEILGFVSNEELAKFYQNCRAFIFAHTEDAGITPLEAAASGRPVIALGKGGVLETVIDGQTGVFFNEETEKSLKEAIINFDDCKFDRQFIRKNAEKYSRQEFIHQFKDIVMREYANYSL